MASKPTTAREAKRRQRVERLLTTIPKVKRASLLFDFDAATRTAARSNTA